MDNIDFDTVYNTIKENKNVDIIDLIVLKKLGIPVIDIMKRQPTFDTFLKEIKKSFDKKK